MAPTVVSDSKVALQVGRTFGFPALPLESVCDGEAPAPSEVLLALVDPEYIPPKSELERGLGGSSVLVVPFVSFGTDRRSVEYFFEQIEEIDFAKACAVNRERVEFLERAKNPLRVVSADCELVVTLGSDLELFVPKLDPIIPRGEWVAVSQFLEVAMIPNADYNCFSVTGTFLADGVAVATHQDNYSRSHPIALEAWRRARALRDADEFPLKLECRDSEVIRINTASGIDVLDQFKDLTDSTFHGRLIEVAFASLPSHPRTDWSINSQVNEAAGGVHIAIGTGVDAAHIDFIAPDAKVFEP